MLLECVRHVMKVVVEDEVEVGAWAGGLLGVIRFSGVHLVRPRFIISNLLISLH